MSKAVHDAARCSGSSPMDDRCSIGSAAQRVDTILWEDKQMRRFVEVAKKSDIPETGVIGVEVEGRRLALINLNGEIYAINERLSSRRRPPFRRANHRRGNRMSLAHVALQYQDRPRHYGPRDA